MRISAGPGQLVVEHAGFLQGPDHGPIIAVNIADGHHALDAIEGPLCCAGGHRECQCDIKRE
jgi:hypothetical protein